MKSIYSTQYQSRETDPYHNTEERRQLKIVLTPVSAASGGYLARPSNIYAESKAEVSTSMPSAEEPVPAKDCRKARGRTP